MIRTLIVEDEPIAAQAHRHYVDRVAGFEVVGVVHAGTDALRFCSRHAVDLVLLDMYLPDMSGLDLCRALRAGASTADVIAVTSARDIAMVKSAVSAGVVQYLLKPFTYASMHAKLTHYAQFRASSGTVTEQADVDRMLTSLRSTTKNVLPKGMSEHTLEAVRTAVAESAAGLSATAAGEVVGVSRVTARRYLEHLADTGFAERAPAYGNVGRPEVVYRRG